MRKLTKQLINLGLHVVNMKSNRLSKQEQLQHKGSCEALNLDVDVRTWKEELFHIWVEF